MTALAELFKIFLAFWDAKFAKINYLWTKETLSTETQAIFCGDFSNGQKYQKLLSLHDEMAVEQDYEKFQDRYVKLLFSIKNSRFKDNMIVLWTFSMLPV